MFDHYRSFSFMFFHVLSCSFIFFHFLSFSFIFFHFLPFSFIFCHFLLYSFFLSGAQNLIFFGLNFDTISLDNSYVKNQFFGPISGGRPLGPLFFFFLLFCPVFCFFLAFYFFIFRRKSFFFSFFLYFFQIFFLLASVSEFNCFLRSRCSMEMWCPDDIGRECWDWVGPPAWGRACFNSPEWGGGSSPVKTEPHQIVSLLLVVEWFFIVKE